MVPAQQMLTLNGNDQMNGLNKRKIYILAVELRSGLKKKKNRSGLCQRELCVSMSQALQMDQCEFSSSAAF